MNKQATIPDLLQVGADDNVAVSGLDAKVLIVEQGSDSPAVGAARARQIQVLELCTDNGQPAGTFTLKAGSAPKQLPVATGDLAEKLELG